MAPTALEAEEFATLMVPLGPYGAAPAIAVAVSGGPHSLALALLARDWVRLRGGSLLALIADHGLRPESAAEARAVAATLHGADIAARILTLGLAAGPRLQERAREARLSALLDACAAAGSPWLLLGHHRADQAETLLFRALRGSFAAGLAAMAPVRPAEAGLILRPLLGVAPARLEAVCARHGLEPVRDPSNLDDRFARIRLRAALRDVGGEGAGSIAPEGAGSIALAAAATAFARRRERDDRAVAVRLAAATELRPEGFAFIDPGALGLDRIAVAALARLIRLVAGAPHGPSRAATRHLLGAGAGTLGGAWLRPAAGGRWLLQRDLGGLAPDQPARAGMLWDGRFRLRGAIPDGLRLVAGRATGPGVPSGARRGMPVLRDGHNRLVGSDSVGYPGGDPCFRFAPRGGAVT